MGNVAAVNSTRSRATGSPEGEVDLHRGSEAPEDRVASRIENVECCLGRSVLVQVEQQVHGSLRATEETLVDVWEVSWTINAQVRSLRVEHRDGLGLRVAVACAVDRRPSALQRVAVCTVTVGTNFSVVSGAWSTVTVVTDTQAGNRSHSWNCVTLHIHHVCGE